MYRYDEIDATLVAERVAQFRDQTRRFLDGKLPEDEYRPLRLRNGLYIQKHAPMLRVAVPYGLLSTRQLRMLAHLARKYDRGYGHFTTRQNIQYNWPKLEDVPDMLADLASVEMHAIQTSGNCIRNTTADHFAGIAPDEVDDPRPYCEIIRQWSTLHPEFSYLPRKFKIAVTGSPADRAASEVHDIGLHLKRDAAGQVGFEVLVGGGLGRTPRPLQGLGVLQTGLRRVGQGAAQRGLHQLQAALGLAHRHQSGAGVEGIGGGPGIGHGRRAWDAASPRAAGAGAGRSPAGSRRRRSRRSPASPFASPRC